MLRKIVDYKKLDHQLATLLIETYPDGYGDDDIICFRNLQGENIEAVELKTDEVIYLVKISQSLAKFIAEFDDSIERELDASIRKVVKSESENEEEQDYEDDDYLDKELAENEADLDEDDDY